MLHAEKCIAFTENGNICGKPAEILDVQRGGMVCRKCSARPLGPDLVELHPVERPRED